MQKVHDASKNNKWKNLPSLESPIVAEEMNRNEQTVDELDNRIIVLDASKAVRTIQFTKATGVFRITYFNGTYFDINTDMEKIAVNFRYDSDPESEHYQELIITNSDGTFTYVDLSALITQYEFLASSTIQPVIEAGKVIFQVINGSITEDKLEPNFLGNCRLEVNKAQNAAKDSEAWAVGQREGADVPDTDETYQNNSKYYSEQSGQYAQSALDTKEDCEDILEEVKKTVDMFNFYVDFESGELIYQTTAAFSFEINVTTGNLEWEVVE